MLYGECAELHNQFLNGDLVGFTNSQLLFLKDNLSDIHRINLFENGNYEGSEIVDGTELYLFKLNNKTEMFIYDDDTTCHCGSNGFNRYKVWYRNDEIFMVELEKWCNSCIDIYGTKWIEEFSLWHIMDE